MKMSIKEVNLVIAMCESRISASRWELDSNQRRLQETIEIIEQAKLDGVSDSELQNFLNDKKFIENELAELNEELRPYRELKDKLESTQI